MTYYEFHKEEVDAALDHHEKGGASGGNVAHEVAERVHNKDAFNMLMVRAHARGTPLHLVSHTHPGALLFQTPNQGLRYKT